MIAFKALSALLTYPSADLQVAIPEVRAALGAHATALAPLLTRLESDDITDLQESYVLLFDRSRTRSLTCSSISTAKAGIVAARWWICWRPTAPLASI